MHANVFRGIQKKKPSRIGFFHFTFLLMYKIKSNESEFRFSKLMMFTKSFLKKRLTIDYQIFSFFNKNINCYYLSINEMSFSRPCIIQYCIYSCQFNVKTSFCHSIVNQDSL